MRKVEVVPYNKQWLFMFAAESYKLKSIFGNELIEIQHIGSTSVPGLKAKPIIDMMPIVKDIKLIDSYNAEMEHLGYHFKGENGIAGRRYFQKGGDNRTHHVHIYQIGSPEIERHLAFRDYLCFHPAAREKYGELKEKLALSFPYDIDSYIRGKETLASEIETQALGWYKSSPNR